MEYRFPSLGGKGLYLLSHLASPRVSLFRLTLVSLDCDQFYDDENKNIPYVVEKHPLNKL